MPTEQRMVFSLAIASLMGAVVGAGAAWSLLSWRGGPEGEAARSWRELENSKRALRAVVEKLNDANRESLALVEERDRLRKLLESGRQGTGETPAAPAVKPPPAAPAARTPALPDPGDEMEKKARALSEPWREDALQIKDEAKRNAALAAVREALASSDPVQVLAGLYAVRNISQVPYDKAPYRALVVAQLDSPDPLLRRAAVFAVGTTSTAQGPEPGDVALLLRLKDDPSPLVRRDLATAISWAARGDLTGEAGEVVLRVIEEIQAEEGAAAGKGGRSAVIQALGGSTYFRKPSPEIEEKLLALARDPGTRESALHFFFQNMEKTPKVVDVLVEIAEEGGAGSDNAVRCLTYTVPAEQGPRVAAFLAKVLESGGARNLQQCLFGLRNFGTEAELPALDRLAANELLDARSRKSITEAAEFIRRRVKR